jgi:glutaredoxin-related protein
VFLNNLLRNIVAKLSIFVKVPRVFIGGKFIGGGNETAELHRNKQLAKMLKDVGAIL